MASQNTPLYTLENTTTSGPQTEFAQGDINKVLSTTAAGLSIIGALVIVITFVMWPDLRTNSRNIILFISIGDLFVAITNIVGVYRHSHITCEIEATLNIVAILSSFFWTVFLSVYFYVTICRKISLEMEARMMRFFHVTAWGIPLLLAAIALGDRAVGNSNDFVSSGWCWIKYRQDWWKMMLWMFLAGKGWEILAYVTICVFYVLVKLQIRREMKMGIASGGHFLTLKSIEVVKKADRKLTFIPVVFILLRMWGTIRFFRFLACHPENPPALKWLVILHGIGDSSQGFANFFLFCLFTDKIRKKFRQCCERFIPRCSVEEKDPMLESTNLAYGARDFYA
ncbi:G-protein coupled receptor 157-like isoform X1 [Porites lutea]|uniref:G-protein coupled receptor 157-like isoform X1 n=1 Tax=Porites lutea TaxID=51062 RepID=UPI003CC6B213